MTEHCEICSMNLQNNIQLQSHLAGKKHLKKVQLAQLVERSIFISPLPKFITEHELIKFFYEFGNIVWYRFGANHAIIEFDSRKSPDILLNQPIWIKNTKLDIKKRILYNDPKGPKSKNQATTGEKADPISYNNIKEVFDRETTFNDQLRAFLKAVSLSDVEIETRYASVCAHLDSIFRVVFPKCKTHKFGSTQTGLGFKECDLDIYMDIGEPINETTCTSSKSWSMNKIFKEVKRIMYKTDCVFSHVISIPTAKTPIIKFWHVPTNISCDISFKSSLGICKSYLLKYYISLDSRLKPLIMLIKYWARHFGISGSGKISNYALILLIMFYLQQPSITIVPPVMELQKYCEPQIVDGWQVNFNGSEKLPSVTNKNSIPELLYGFFCFYATFEFKSQVICPLDGKTHRVTEFKEIDSLPSCMDRYKTYVKGDDSVKKFNILRPICVQDPIELVHNVTACASISTLDSFVKHCVIGAKICTETNKNDYRDLVGTLLTTAPKRKKSENKFQVTIYAKPLNNTKDPGAKETCIDVVEKIIFTESHWYLTVFNIVKDIFEKVFKVQVELLTADTEAKQQKMEILSDVHTKQHQKVIFQCMGNHCIWRNRKIYNVFDPSSTALEKETITSDQMIEKFKQEDPRRKIKLNFTCILEKKTQPLRVHLTLNDENSDNCVFQEFACFAKRKLIEIVDKTLMHMRQYR